MLVLCHEPLAVVNSKKKYSSTNLMQDSSFLENTMSMTIYEKLVAIGWLT